jgi:hypothetical protein
LGIFSPLAEDDREGGLRAPILLKEMLMTDQKPTDWKRDARSVVLALAAGAAIVAPTATPLMAASLDELRGGVTEMLNAPPNHVRAFQDLVGRKLMHSGYGEVAIVAAGAEEALHERGEEFSITHTANSVKMARLVFDVAMESGLDRLGDMQQLHAQGQQLVETGQINVEQLEAWTGEIVDFAANGMAEIEAVSQELAEAGVPDFTSATFAYGYMQAFSGGDAKAALAEQADVPPAVLAAAERLEAGAVAQMGRIRDGMAGEFSWVAEKRTEVEPN